MPWHRPFVGVHMGGSDLCGECSHLLVATRTSHVCAPVILRYLHISIHKNSPRPPPPPTLTPQTPLRPRPPLPSPPTPPTPTPTPPTPTPQNHQHQHQHQVNYNTNNYGGVSTSLKSRVQHIDGDGTMEDKAIVLTAQDRYRARSQRLHSDEANMNVFETLRDEKSETLSGLDGESTKTRMFWGLISKWEQSLRQEFIQSNQMNEL